jgi:FMN phosphatase YigB (HAD superfamily)
MTKSLASFDVFDTVLTRAVGSPEAVFFLLGRRLAETSWFNWSADSFARARIKAEERAYHVVRDACSLESIYAELAMDLALSDAQCDHLMRCEWAIEAALIRPVPGARERVARRRAEGRRVAFLSDIYLPSSFVEEQLVRHGLWQPGDACYVSPDHKQSKRSGALFITMLRTEGVSASDAVHHGNSSEHDLQPALRAGLSVEPFLAGNLNHFEQLLEGHGWTSDGLASVLAGAARLARLSVPVATAKAEAMRDVVAGVAAPTLVAFVLWVLRRAQERGVKRLYFLSRDGQILVAIASQLCQALHLGLELRYLYGSRQAWNLAATPATPADTALAWIWDSTDFLSVESLLARVRLHPEEVADALLAAGFSPADWRRRLSPGERLKLRSVLRDDRAQTLVSREAARQRRVVLAYFKQEGVLDQTPWGMVDLGWYGSMQNALSTLVRESGGVDPVGFYFALLKGEVVDNCPANREAYFVDERATARFGGPVPDIIPLMEMFCAADHGSVAGFGAQNGRVEPILVETCNQKVVAWGLPLVRRTVQSFVENLVLVDTLVNPWADVRPALTDVLRAFWVHPSEPIARAWSDFPWEDGLGYESYWNPLAQGYRWRDLFASLRRGRVVRHHRTSWPAGSLALSPRPIRAALSLLARLRWYWIRMRSPD